MPVREFITFWGFIHAVEKLNPKATPAVVGVTIHFFYENGRALGHWDNHIGQGFIYETDPLIGN